MNKNIQWIWVDVVKINQSINYIYIYIYCVFAGGGGFPHCWPQCASILFSTSPFSILAWSAWQFLLSSIICHLLDTTWQMQASLFSTCLAREKFCFQFSAIMSFIPLLSGITSLRICSRIDISNMDLFTAPPPPPPTLTVKFMHFKDAPKGFIGVKSDEIAELKEYCYLSWMVNMCWDLDVEILWRRRSGGVFTTIKDVLKANLDKTLRANHFNNSILPAMVYTDEMWSTIKMEEQNLVIADAFHFDLWKRQGWKAFTRIKDVLKTNLDKTLHSNVFNVFPVML